MRQFIQSVLGLAILATSNLALSNTEYTYNLIDGGIEVTGCLYDCPTAMIIPNEVDGLNVVSIGENAFHSKGIESVIIPEGIKVIGRGAFHSNMLTSLALPNSLEYLAGFNNNQITTLAIPNKVTTIGIEAFENNKLISVLIPDSVTKIENQAFWENILTEITLPKNLSEIAAFAFYSNLIEVLNIPESVSYIGERAFLENPLQVVNFHGDRPFLGDNVFALTYEKDVSFYDSLCYEFLPGELHCPSISVSLENVVAAIEINFTENKTGWPGQDVFINEYKTYTICTDDVPTSACVIGVAKEYVTPQLNSNSDSAFSYSVFDIDQNGSFDALTDGLILLRYAFALRGENLINGAIASDATRTSASEIEAHIQSYLP